MKRSSIILAAMLSGFALASPDAACGQATVTVTQVITTTLSGNNASAQSQAVVPENENQAESAPSVAVGGAFDAAAPTSIAVSPTVADSSAATPPAVNDSAASSNTDTPSAQPDSSSPSGGGSSDDATGDSDSIQEGPAPVTVTEIVTSIINGGASTITMTNVATHYSSDPMPAAPVVTTITKIYTSIINGGASTVTVTKTEEHTLSRHRLHGTGIRTGSAGSPTHHVSVGKDGKMAYEPSFINAAVGDTVRFRFFPTNHTVTSSDFDTPCKKNDGFDSGFKPTFISNSTTFVDYSVKDASKPLWFHSRQKDECKQGMVFAINPKDQDQFKQFVAKASNPSLNQTDSKPSNDTTTKSNTPVVLSTNTTAVNATKKATPMRFRI